MMPTTSLSSRWEDQQMTHMPFLVRSGPRFDLVFARSTLMRRRAPHHSLGGTMRIWRLAWVRCNPKVGSWSDVQSLHTGLGRNELECSPCVSHLLGKVHVSFIGSCSHGTGTLKHHLYRMSGASLSDMRPAIRVSEEEAYCGFWRPDLTVMAADNKGVIHLRGSVNARLHTGFGAFARISFDPDAPERLLITGAIAGDTRIYRGRPFPHTIVYDIHEERVLGELRLSGGSVYKPSLCGNLMATAQPCTVNRERPATPCEAMKIVFSKDFELVPSDIPVRATRG